MMRGPTVALMLALSLASAARADDPVHAAQALIQSQIEAFLHDDAATAYSFASPGIRSLFPDKDAFFAMVRKTYQPVYHPGNYGFGMSRAIDDGNVVYQQVLISGTDGKAWSAIYQVTRQPDGSYKINGVQIIPDTTSQGI